MQRRGFLGAILAAGVAPAFVGSSILMPVRQIFVPPRVDLAKVLPHVPLEHGVTITTAASPGLKPGDIITIAGIPGTYRVQAQGFDIERSMHLVRATEHRLITGLERPRFLSI